MNDPASLQSILYWVVRKIGIVPSGDNENLDPDKAYEILGFIDDRLREGWDMYDFVETTICEERAFRDDFDSEICYPKDSIVWDWCSRQYYQALLTQTGGPLSNASVWAPNPNVSPRWIPWNQTNKATIGACFGAWTKNPYEDPSRIRMFPAVSRRGLEFTLCKNTTTAWLLFRLPYPGIGLMEWDPALPYSQGDTTFASPDSFISLVDGNVNNNPAISPEKWQCFRVPYPFVRFVRQAAFSDTLIVDGQNEKAPAELNAAFGYLAQAFDQQNLQQAQRQNWTGYTR